MPVSERLRKRLDTHPEKRTITFAGEDRNFLLSGWSAKAARAQGTDPVAAGFRILKSMMPVLMKATKGEAQKAQKTLDREKMMEAGVSWLMTMAETATGELIEDYCAVVWWGLLTYEPELELEEVEIMMTPGEIISTFSSIFNDLLSFDKSGKAKAAAASKTAGDDPGDSGN